MSIVKKTLGELCIIEKGKIGIQKAIPGEFPLVVTAEERLSHNEYHFEGNAVVIPLVSSTGHGHKSLKRIHFQSGKFAVGNILCVVMPKDETLLNAEYLYRYLDLNREKELVGRMKGMANVTLPLKEIALIEMPLPPLAEQMKFVDEYKQLETIKNKLDAELTHQLILVKQLRQSFLREAMQGKLTADFRSTHPELIEGENSSQALLNHIAALTPSTKKRKEAAPISEDEIPFEIPESWVWCRLGEVSINKDSDRKPISLNERERKEKIYDYYGASGVIDKIDGYTHDGNYLLIGEDGANLVAKSTPIAFIAEGKFWVNNHAHVLEYKENTMTQFMCYCLNIVNIQPYITGGFQPKLSQGNLILIPIPIPPLFEQQAIVSKLNELMRTCDELEASIRTNQKQNEMLLQQVLREALKG
jgi:type I restriction enzyme S subunit